MSLENYATMSAFILIELRQQALLIRFEEKG